MKIKDPYDLSPEHLVRCGYKIPKWADDWYKSKKAMNASGLRRERDIDYIKEMDPEYYEQFKHLHKDDMRRKETTPIPKTKHILIHTSM